MFTQCPDVSEPAKYMTHKTALIKYNKTFNMCIKYKYNQFLKK